MYIQNRYASIIDRACSIAVFPKYEPFVTAWLTMLPSEDAFWNENPIACANRDITIPTVVFDEMLSGFAEFTRAEYAPAGFVCIIRHVCGIPLKSAHAFST